MTTESINDPYAYRSKLPFVKYEGGSRIVWWNVTPTGKWALDFKVGRQYAQKFWEVCGSGRAFALEFQQITLGMLLAAKTYKSPGYSGVEAGFLLAVGELSGGVINIERLLQNSDARPQRTRALDEPLSWDATGVGRYTPDDWEFGVSRLS